LIELDLCCFAALGLIWYITFRFELRDLHEAWLACYVEVQASFDGYPSTKNIPQFDGFCMGVFAPPHGQTSTI
jgi:hypothetical protein